MCYEGQGSITPIIAAPASNTGVVLERARASSLVLNMLQVRSDQSVKVG